MNYTKKEKKLMINYLKRVMVLFKNNEWIQGAYARDSKNRIVASIDSNAVKFCLGGALYHNRLNKEIVFSKVYNYLERDILGRTLVVWNDTKGRTKKQVLGALQRAITKLERM